MAPTRIPQKRAAPAPSPKLPSSVSTVSSTCKRAKLTKGQQKTLVKKENRFAKSVNAIFKVSQRENLVWCKQQLDKNPSWVPFLTSIFQNGTFEKMLTQDERRKAASLAEETYGKRLSDRIKTIAKAPMSEKEKKSEKEKHFHKANEKEKHFSFSLAL